MVLSNSTPVEVMLEEFLNTQAVQKFESLLRGEMVAALEAANPSWFRELASFQRLGRDFVKVVLTGGGAASPMVKRLGRGHVDIHGRRFPCQVAEDLPEWIADNYPALRDEYAQLAVAIGGAARDLPEVAAEVGSFAGMGGKRPAYESTTQYK